MKLLVIDSNSIINRAFFGIRMLTNKKGVATNALTGFFNIYFKLLKKYSPDGAAAAFDMRAPTFRHNKYTEYKAGRKSMPEELFVQVPYCKELLRALGVPVVECEGYEADDILGTLAAACEKDGGECVLATGDRDSFQLVSDKTFVNLASTKEDVLYTPEKIFEVYGVEPALMRQVKALMGDSSDNIPGVKGIGEKTALSLIQKYHDIDYIYSHLGELEVTASVKQKLAAGEESARLSLWLGTISKEAPIDTDISHYRFGGRDEVRLASLLTQLEMFAMLKKLGLSEDAVNTAAALSVGEGFAGGEAGEEGDKPAALDEHIPDFYSDGEKLFETREGSTAEADKTRLLTSDPKRTFDYKAMLTEFGDFGGSAFDTTLAAYLLNTGASEYGAQRLCAEYGVKSGEANENWLYELNNELNTRLTAQGMSGILSDIEIPLAKVLVSMEKDGVAVDREAIERFGEQLTLEIAELEGRIQDMAGEKFNVASPKQLGTVLFEKLGLPGGKKTKTGYSTNADVLEKLKTKHPIIDLILNYRALTKLNGTYAQGLLKVIAPDGRIHTTYKQTETRTGRISSVEPNIQNIPVRTERGREFRRFFKAKDGCLLVDADYSQIELRILAHMADDKTMRDAFLSGEDIHTVTASQVFDQPVEWVTPEMRRSAKAVNFGIVYGISAFSLSQDINVSVSQADAYIKAYLKKYSGVDAFMKRTVEEGMKNGYVSTIWGRRRFIPELSSTNKIVQALGKRMAMNAPIQGSAADIIKLAMIRVYDRLAREKLDARLILQVHDELIVEAAENEAQRVADLLREEMENAAKLSVPLTVDAKIGKTWYEAH